jgi:hypothetical protein
VRLGELPFGSSGLTRPASSYLGIPFFTRPETYPLCDSYSFALSFNHVQVYLNDRGPYEPATAIFLQSEIWLIILPIGAGLVWIALEGLECGCMPHGISSFLLGLLPIAVGSLLTVRRLAFHSYLLLDRDAFILPTGLLRVRTTQIPYIGIERVWQTRLPWMAVLCVATKGGKFEVLSGMLPDTSSYIAVGNFLNSRAQDNLKNASAISAAGMRVMGSPDLTS